MSDEMSRMIEVDRNRRSVIRAGLGSAFVLALAACGGGGGGSSEELNLRAGYDGIVEGMNRADVVRLVGVEPSEESSDGTMYWTTVSENLWVDIHDTSRLVAWVRWDKNSSPSASLSKTFY